MYYYLFIAFFNTGHYRHPGANRFDGAPGMFIIHSSTSKGKESDDDDDDSTLDVDAALGESVSVSGMYMAMPTLPALPTNE